MNPGFHPRLTPLLGCDTIRSAISRIRTEALGRTYKFSGSKKDARKEHAAPGNMNLEVVAGELYGLLGLPGMGKRE